MPELVLVRDESGKLDGLGDRNQRSWRKFTSAVRQMEIGETVVFSYKKPRSPKFHRFFFAKLNRLFEMQEQFADIDQLRAWLTVGAGECDFVPGPKGRMVALPKSIAWHRMDDEEFGELVVKVDQFLQGDHAQRFLWPHLGPREAGEMIQSLEEEFR